MKPLKLNQQDLGNPQSVHGEFGLLFAQTLHNLQVLATCFRCSF